MHVRVCVCGEIRDKMSTHRRYKYNESATVGTRRAQIHLAGRPGRRREEISRTVTHSYDCERCASSRSLSPVVLNALLDSDLHVGHPHKTKQKGLTSHSGV